ncbi:MAG: sugar ABC transporter substrate-binding protein [Alphaproteobacteria bacterium]
MQAPLPACRCGGPEPADGDRRPRRAAPNTARSAARSHHDQGPHSANEAAFEAIVIEDFNRDVAPNVKVNFTTYDWANMNTELTTGFASGSPPDVLYLVDLIYPAYARQGVLHDMTELVSDPAWEGRARRDRAVRLGPGDPAGQHLGRAVLGAVYNIFLNLDLLDAAGVTGSWDGSYAAMLEAAQKMTRDDVYGFSMRSRVADFAFWDWFPYMHNAGADIFNADWSGCGLDNDDAKAAMQFLIDIHAAGVTPAVGSVDWQGMSDMFKAGRIAIHHGETPMIAELMANDPGFRWDVARAPGGPQGRTAMGNFGILCIAEASQNKEAAWEFIKHWASGPMVGRFAEQVNLQVVRSDIVDGLFDGNPAMQKVQTEFVPTVKGVQPHPKILQAMQTMWPTAEDAYLGNLTGAEAIDEMCEAIEGVL